MRLDHPTSCCALPDPLSPVPDQRVVPTYCLKHLLGPAFHPISEPRSLSHCSVGWLSSNTWCLPKQKPSLRAAHPAHSLGVQLRSQGFRSYEVPGGGSAITPSCVLTGEQQGGVAAWGGFYLSYPKYGTGHGFSVEDSVMIGKLPGEIGGGFPTSAEWVRAPADPLLFFKSIILGPWLDRSCNGGSLCVLVLQAVIPSQACGGMGGIHPRRQASSHRVCPVSKCWWAILVR